MTSIFGWREAFAAEPGDLHPVNHDVPSLSVYLGALGMTGMTAWAGLNLVDVKAGDVIYISGAAGAVGNVAGQLAKLRRCRVIGSAGSDEKCGYCTPGLICSAVAMLSEIKAGIPSHVTADLMAIPTLTAGELRERMSGNLCRCGAYSNIAEAITEVAGRSA